MLNVLFFFFNSSEKFESVEIACCIDDCNACFWELIHVSFESSNYKSNNLVMLLGGEMWKNFFFFHMFLNGMLWTLDKFVEYISKQNSWLKIMAANHRTDRVNGDLYWKDCKHKIHSWTVFPSGYNYCPWEVCLLNQ